MMALEIKQRVEVANIGAAFDALDQTVYSLNNTELQPHCLCLKRALGMSVCAYLRARGKWVEGTAFVTGRQGVFSADCGWRQ